MSLRQVASVTLAGLVALTVFGLSGCGGESNTPKGDAPSKSQPSEISKPKPPPPDPG